MLVSLSILCFVIVSYNIDCIIIILSSASFEKYNHVSSIQCIQLWSFVNVFW